MSEEPLVAVALDRNIGNYFMPAACGRQIPPSEYRQSVSPVEKSSALDWSEWMSTYRRSERATRSREGENRPS